ncbi:MAG: HlyC/CorC family transporter [Methylobacter sp.]|uniref:HlyC/CorC family transporter n=1 Tax=Methylobacter sp. TaxID=2051955 RepID=UPI0027320AB8|nr:HlyC/CorC family transporter [Methylobacter sp.]MDP1665384.1 HlyC/CorC family transporter [Methylobacter sp.]MDP1970267.1 HlyC/CorC family transporter [Methylobacter sp.]
MNDIPLSMLFGILAAMLILSAFFSGSETALMTLNRYRLKHLVKLNHSGAIKAHQLLQRPERLLGLILLCNNFVNNFASSIATVIAIKLYADEESSVAIAAGILTIVMLICSEVTPKTLAAIKPEPLAFPAAWIYTLLLKILYPVVWFVNLFVNLLLRIIGVDVKKNRHDALNKDELKSIISDAESLMPIRYQKMLMGILELESATVEDIMTPRNEIIGIDLELPIEGIIAQIKTSPHTRLPVYKTSIDRIIGFIHLRKILVLLNQQDFDKQTIINALDKPSFIPESTPVHNQMQRFKHEKIRIGLVVDEYGDVQGLVTLDDLLQEIVGELITDDVAVRAQSDGSYLVDANITIRELNRVTQWALPTEGPKTLNGLIIEFMETIPETGTSIRLHDYLLEIIKRDENSVKLVRFLPKK